MRVDVTPSARRQAAKAKAWWREHRSAAPLLFENELADAIALLVEQPEAGQPLPRPRSPHLRRLLLRRTRYHVFYKYDAADSRILILAVWSAVRGRGPKLPRS